MGCRLYLLYVMNFFALLLGVGLLVLGVRTQMGGLTGLALVILVITFLGCCGSCTESSCMLIAYSICMLLLAMLCVGFLVNPQSVKPLVAEQLQELVLASYMNSGRMDDLKCCPTVPLQPPKDAETWVSNKIMYVGNKIMCASVGVMGLPSCEDAIDDYLDVHGKGIAITTLVLAITAAAVAGDRAAHNRRK